MSPLGPKDRRLYMGRSTGIELGPDSCVIVAARQGRGAIDVSAVHVVAPADWPSHDVAITAALKAARRARRLPRRAAVVLWGLPDDAASAEPSTRAAVRPITAAGFKVDSIISPPQALAALAATRPRQDPAAAVAWMALNTYGVALAIVRNGELLFSRTFDWAYRPDVSSSRGQLLQRYSLVSHLAPEMQRGIAAVRAAYGVTVDTAVTCGDLPDLRSLTMPLIEELDLEVETLDSTEGLRPTGRAKGDRFAESAPGIRVAVAAAVLPDRRRGSVAAPLRKAAAVVLFAGLGWLAYSLATLDRGRPVSSPGAPQIDQAPPPAEPAPGTPVDVTAAPAVSSPVTTPLPVPVPPATVSTEPGPPAPAAPREPAPARAGTLPPVSPSPVATSTRDAGAPKAPPVPSATVARSEPPPVPPLPAAERPASSPPDPPVKPVVSPPAPAAPRPRPVAPPQVADAPQVQALPRVAATSPPARVQPPAPSRKPDALRDPLPRIDSILIDHSRRLAIVNGRIVGVGDVIGPRVVVRIEAEAVILREPSGLDVRVLLKDARESTGL